MNVSHLFAVNSGGRLSLDAGGYRVSTPPPAETLHATGGPGAGKGSSSGGGGGGHAGSGGRGRGVSQAGLPYGSLFAPVDYGSAGGTGGHFGKKNFSIITIVAIVSSFSLAIHDVWPWYLLHSIRISIVRDGIRCNWIKVASSILCENLHFAAHNPNWTYSSYSRI